MGFGKNHMSRQRVRKKEGDVARGRQIFVEYAGCLNNEDDSHDLLLLHDVIKLSFVPVVLIESPPSGRNYMLHVRT